MFTEKAEEIVTGIAAHAAIAIDNARLLAAVKEEVRSKELLLNEFQHRMQNTLATVQAIASQTLGNAPLDEREAFGARLQALAGVHNLLTERNWNRALMGDVVQRAARDRFKVDGPEAHTEAKDSSLLALALHELATNAVKRGGLSNGVGKVSITWKVENKRVILRWQESGGSLVVAPARWGFGSVLIEQASDAKARLEFLPEGVVCGIEMPLAARVGPATAVEP